jgi:hypothetical protein
VKTGYYAYRPRGCVPACIASMLGQGDLAWSLPCADSEAWLDRLNEHLAEQASAWLAHIPHEALPWREPDVEWIAGITSADGTPHAVVAIGEWCAFDPADELKPGDPLPEVGDGFLLLPNPQVLRLHRIEQLGRAGRAGPGHNRSRRVIEPRRRRRERPRAVSRAGSASVPGPVINGDAGSGRRPLVATPRGGPRDAWALPEPRSVRFSLRCSPHPS